MPREHKIQLRQPGPRPPYYSVAEHLWGKNCYIDSNGNFDAPADPNWTELSLYLRANPSSNQVHVEVVSEAPLVLGIRSSSQVLCERATEYLASTSGGAIDRRQYAAPRRKILWWVLVRTIVRAVVAAAVSAGSVVLALLAGALGGSDSGRGGLSLAAVVMMFALGWALLPAIRISRVVAALSMGSWVALAVFLSQFGDGSVRGWMLGPYAFATLLLGACLVFNPPYYVRRM